MTSQSMHDLRSKVAELLIVRISGYSQDHYRQYPRWEMANDQLRKLLKEGLGGVIIWGGSCRDIQHRCQNLNKWSNKKILICADIEEGFGQRFHGGSWFIPPMGIGQLFKKNPLKATELAESYGRSTGRQAKSCGLNWVLGPVCDINSNSKNPVINVRAWGEDSLTVSALTCAFQKGVAQTGVLTCAKHFPGHGDTHCDSHLELPALQHHYKNLDELELIPFRKVIHSGIDSVMTGHLLLKNIDSKYPSSLSYELTTNLLRKKIGFQGLVITDALMMNSITRKYSSGEAAVLAFSAGADLILMPEDPSEAINSLIQAIEKGEISMARVEESLERRRNAIKKISNFEITRNASINSCEIENNEERKLKEELITNSSEFHNEHTITIHTNGINLIRVDNSVNCPILIKPAPALSIPESAGYKSLICDELSISPWRKDKNEPLDLARIGNGPILLQLFIRGNPFRGGKERNEPWVNAVKQLQSKRLLSGLIVYGTPYLWEELLNVIEPHIAAAYSPGQTNDVQDYLLKKLMKQSIFIDQKAKKAHNVFTD